MVCVCMCVYMHVGVHAACACVGMCVHACACVCKSVCEHPKKKFLQDLETIRSMILQDHACKITTDFGTISREIMPE